MKISFQVIMVSEFFIKGHVPSSKNSKVWTGKHLIHSKQTREYIASTKMHYFLEGLEFKKATKNLKKPLILGFKFIRSTKHKFDYINMLQIVQDMMVKYHWIDDDNCDEVMPMFQPYEYNKDKPGVLISIL